MLKHVLSFGLVASAPAAQSAVFTFPQPGFNIPTSGPVNPSIVYVEGVTGVVKNVAVKLNGITHGYASETMIAISNPNGLATLIWDAPSCKFSYSNIQFTDTATSTFEMGCRGGFVMLNGDYKSANSVGARRFTIPIAPIIPFYKTLNELILSDVNGRWILWAEDFVSGDGGTVASWELVIETEDPPLADETESYDDEESSDEGSPE
jgi:subtilisin-like proprotein convertase family protein